MKKGLRFSIVALMLSIAAPIACGVTQGNSGSNTNWLRICTDDADCSSGYSCLCGVCTSPCELDGDGCEEASAQCTAVSKVGCEPRDDHDNACLPSCSEDADCDRFGAGLACETGVCVAATALEEPPDPPDLELPDLEPLGGTPRLALGANSACVSRAGRVWCWGSNEVGQAAQPPSGQSMPIAEIQGIDGVTQIVASSSHKCALLEDGRVSCWGLNDRGQVGPEVAPEMTCSRLVLDKGPEDIPCQPTPTLVPDLPEVSGLALNDTTTCAWFEDGDFTCWGETSYLEAAAEELSEGVSWLALGNDTLCAASRATDELWCTGDEAPSLASIGEVALSTDFDGGPTFGCALDVRGDVNCWGRDDSGQRGLSSFGSPEPNPGDEPAIREDAVEVHVGQNHACALLVDDAVVCWGRNDFSQTGTPPNVTPRCAGMPCQPTPTRVAGIPPAVDLASRGSATCALSKDAELYCWGGIDSGSAWRIPGPWEGGKNTCDRIDHAVSEEIREVRTAEYVYTGCETVRDCVEVELGVSCHRGCQGAPMHQNQASEITAELARIEDTYCSSAEQLDCSFAQPECPSRPGELACVEGACVRFDRDATGCDDACACKVLENLANEPPLVEQQCEGHHLMLHRFVNCGDCGSSRLYFAIANYGQTAFDGDVTVELWSDSGTELPEPMSFSLTLEPGEPSEPIYFEFSEASGPAYARLVVADNCDYMAEWSDAPFDIPAPATCSE